MTLKNFLQGFWCFPCLWDTLSVERRLKWRIYGNNNIAWSVDSHYVNSVQMLSVIYTQYRKVNLEWALEEILLMLYTDLKHIYFHLILSILDHDILSSWEIFIDQKFVALNVIHIVYQELHLYCLFYLMIL